MQTPHRIALIDLARTIAIAAMVAFHFTYDLELFGFAPRGTMASLEWRMFAQAIAGSFIFLSGLSLVLAAQSGPLSLRKYSKRLALLALAALAVTIGTYFANGPAFVRFGILHLLFLASLLGLLALRLPYWLCAAFGAVILALPHIAGWPMFSSAYWLWLSMPNGPTPAMVDYVPLVPWLGMFLLGMSVAQLFVRLSAWPKIAGLIDPDAPLPRAMSWPGQHSLAIYLIHQPLLFGGVYLARLVLGH